MKALLTMLNLPYKDESLYVKALTHASYAYENQTDNNEKLEFLGDAVIELMMSDYLYKEDLADEGTMTKRRAQAVCEEALVKYANKLNLKEYIKLGKGELMKGANDAMVADAFEALFGAVYLDLGFKTASEMFKKIIVPHLNLVWNIKDFKSTLQEYIQSGDKRNISYHIIREVGPSHDKEFEAAVRLDNVITLGVGRGKTKKEAEQNAAHDALKKGNYDLKETL
jgi:ribonuclease-3